MDNSHFFLKNIIWAVVFILGVILLSFASIGILTHHGQALEVPDLTNMNLREAEYNAGLASMRVEVSDSVYIRRMGRGLVYSQNPKPGAKVKSGRLIRLTINSVVPKKVLMPDLVGYSMRQAKAELASRGLALGRLIYVRDMATNNVLRQLCGNYEIEPGTPVESGSRVDLVVGLSYENNKTLIPSVSGLKYLRAVDVIQDNSLNVRRLVFDKSIRSYADSVDAVVRRQYPEASDMPVPIGSEVTLYLSPDPAKGL